MAWNDASSTDIKRLEDTIKKFNKTSTFLGICMLVLTLVQCFLAVVMLIVRR